MMRGKKGFLKTLLALSLVLFLGIPNVQVIYASESGEEATSDISELDEHKSWVKDIKTPLHNGDAFETIRVDLVPVIKALATGTVPNDKVAWQSKDALLYTEGDTFNDAWQPLANCLFNFLAPNFLPFFLGEAVTGIFDLRALRITISYRWFTVDGNKVYRCALAGISVAKWCSPYGDVCSREEALEYYNQCQERIDLVVSKIIAARQSNGEPLTNEQKLKWIHDWLVISADYAYEKLRLHKSDSEKYKFNHLWNEYGAIMDGEAVCKGYTYAFKAIIDELVRRTGDDIECEEAIDIGHEHSWVRVKLDGEWYNIDVTLDDKGFPLVRTSDFYFLVSDEWIDYDKYNSTSLSGATNDKCETDIWETYKKSLSECTVVVKNPAKLYTCEGDLSTAIEVRYGVNVLPPEAYTVVKTYKIIAGTPVSTLMVIPSKCCWTLKGALEIPGSVLRHWWRQAHPFKNWQ